PDYFRPNEVDLLLGDSSRARKLLNWKPKVTFKELAQMMAAKDMEYAKREAALRTPVVSQRKAANYGQSILQKRSRRNKS
ncbi:MAG: GDP-mannose 4,6-dehydratase, partial [Nitrososphaera sp.]